MSLTNEYSQLSIDITLTLNKAEKKQFGIFISPKTIIEKLFQCVIEYSIENNIIIQKILEPSCGTCEIIRYMDERFDECIITGIELNDTIFKAIENLSFKNKVTLLNNDFIQFENNELFDLVITNPPYFVCKKEYVPSCYHEYIYGRPNIFGLFILHSIMLTKENGIIAFVVPKSFLNAVYYSKIRNYIKQTCKIVEIIDFEKDNKFIDTQQSTFGIVLHKTNQQNIEKQNIDCDYSFMFNNNSIFTNDSLTMKNIFNEAKTLFQLGLKVRTGSIVWNENKNELTDDSSKTVLIYNTNITNDNTLNLTNFKNNEKKQYICKDGRNDTILVVNRGNGNSKYKLKYSLIYDNTYLVENHLNEIYCPESSMEKNVLLELFEKIIQSFKHPKTQMFINMYLGNNSLSKTELETIFPIYI